MPVVVAGVREPQAVADLVLLEVDGRLRPPVGVEVRRADIGGPTAQPRRAVLVDPARLARTSPAAWLVLGVLRVGDHDEAIDAVSGGGPGALDTVPIRVTLDDRDLAAHHELRLIEVE